MQETDRLDITDKERTAKAEVKDRVAKAQEKISDREDTVRNIADQPQPRPSDEPV